MTGMHGTIVITKKPGPELTYLHEWAGSCSTISSKLEVRVPRAYTNVVQRQTARNSAPLHLRLSFVFIPDDENCQIRVGGLILLG
ncbi:hypothetical protein BDQ94DRAFT_150070 [Aspergillus welwitschiae]|uniref:Uncharacterized protein n=1 Tax=Aspergillus welwitschiae TaxID=1341132 RepID=A0A3F3PRX4_9EURO|nr:hypothetical protein BDQ94DRAFT_150070 [Aspergillus welwitschiae]RDH29613.1 hypothetical protein BDQ94DRAFT_150070 [Aspergillus welwitschiae]